MPYKYNPLLVGKLDRVGADASRLSELDDVNTSGTVNGKVLTYQSGTWIPAAVAGAGDMLKSVYVEGAGTVYNASRLAGEVIGTVQAHNVEAANILGTIGDANIPDVETLSYAVPFADAQIPTLDATKIISGTFDSAQIPALPTSRIATGTFVADRIPTMENLKGTVPDCKIPDVESLSYGGTFAAAQIPNLAASKITSGSFNANRIPVLPTSRITTGTFGLARIPTMDDARIPDLETLSYGGTFATGQIPNLPTTKITSGTLGPARIPSIDNDHLAGDITSDKIPALSGTAVAYPLDADSVGTTAIKTAGVGNDELAGSGLDISKFTIGTAGLAQVPTMNDAHIPNVDGLGYGGAFATAQVPSIGAYKITSGTLAVARHETLNNLNGTVALSQVPTMDDAHIPDLDGLSYSGAFGTAQVPPIGAYKIASGTLNADRIPALPTARITSGTFNANRIPILPTNRYGSAVLLTGAQSIGGAKTFTDIPILPASNPTADNEAARKAYVDSASAGDTDGGLYSDTYINTADIDGGTF